MQRELVTIDPPAWTPAAAHRSSRRQEALGSLVLPFRRMALGRHAAVA
jgi:hypothetical protein